ncbi:MarR family transcriptional regulator [archaeon]|nr:MarR family transcriptional regulator [archaeon]
MKNRNIGLMLMGVTSLIVLLAWSYDLALSNIINTSCSHGLTCPMYQTLAAQRVFSIILIIIIVGVSSYLLLIDKVRTYQWMKKVKLAVSGKERELYKLLKANNNNMKQSRLIEELGVSKVKMTRILNRLEKKGLVTRKRSGIGNIVKLRKKLVS